MKQSLTTISFIFVCVIASRLFAGDIDVLKERLKESYVTGSASSAETYLADQQTNGSWSDINYADRSRNPWDPIKHMDRMVQMAVAYNTVEHAAYQSSAMVQGISKGLDYWFQVNPYSANWWWKDIGVPNRMVEVLIMMEEKLSSTQINTGCTWLNNPSGTGLNRVGYSGQTVVRGCLKGNLADIKLGMDAIKGVGAITTAEGIQPDFSFHQHGPLFYNYGYGHYYAISFAEWIHLTDGLSFEFNTAQKGVFEDYILDGMQWVTRREDTDMACRGRNITRPNQGKTSYLNDRNILPLMLEFSTSRKEEVQNFIDHIKGTKDDALVGNKHFWRSDYMAHRRKSYHTSVNMCSKRTIGTEQINKENLRGYYLPFGSTVIMLKGDEYHNIYPIWDWARIPGVTSPYKNPTPDFSGSIKGTTDFVGGASDGTYGAAGFDLNYDGVTGRKSWFYFDNEFVALGAGIKSSGTAPVNTSVNQCWMRGDVTVSYDTGSGSTVAKGKSTLKSPRWVFHDSVGYLFPKTGNVELKNEAQTGSWNYISGSESSTATISKDVFSLWLDHGLNPSNATYEYIVVPGVNTATMQNYAGSIPVRTISNTTALQAVRNDRSGVLGAVFYTAGQVTVRAGLTLKVNQPCIALLREYDDKINVTLSNPKAAALNVVAELVWTKGTNEKKTFSLPGGSNGGKSVTLSFSNADPEKITQKVKANNASNLDQAASWTRGGVPTSTDTAIWDATVTAANSCWVGDGSSHSWAGIKVVNPGGPVEIKGSDGLTLGAGGIDLGSATQSLTFNSPVRFGADQEIKTLFPKNVKFNSAVSGAYSVNVVGSGYLLYTSNDIAYSGGTTVSHGVRLHIGNKDTTGVLPGDVVNNSSLRFCRSDDYTYSGVISGTGQVEKLWSGRTTLTGNHSYSGRTNVKSGGELTVNGSLTKESAVTVDSGSTISGTGTIGGSLTIDSGGTVEPGDSGAGKLTVGSGVTLSSTSVVNVDLGTVSDTLAITGDLTLDGTVNINAVEGFSSGTYTIMTYTGTLKDNKIEVGSVPDGPEGFRYSVSVNSGKVLLTVEGDVSIIEIDSVYNGLKNRLLFAPNPASLSDGEIFFSIPQDLTGEMTVTIYDNLGNVIDSQEFYSNGGYMYRWDLRNRSGRQVAAGTYVAVISLIAADGSRKVLKRVVGVTE